MIDNRVSKKVIYTAITGSYNKLITPKYINDNWDYICFTDNPSVSSDFWKIVKMEDLDLDPAKKIRKYKILAHEYLSMYDCSLWIDFDFDIRDDIDKYIADYHFASSMLCMIHPNINCIYQESKAFISLANNYEDIIRKQTEKYRADGYPVDFGLIAAGVLFREHNDVKLQKVMREWWNEVEMFSRWEQLSFNYVCWKNRYAHDISYLPYLNNKFFVRTGPGIMNPILITQLFWKHESYSEELSRKKCVILDNDKFNVIFYIKDCNDIHNSESLRFDPTNFGLKLRKIEATAHFLDGSSYALEVLNTNHTVAKNGLLIFNHHDPQIEFVSDMIDWDSCSHIEFSGELVLGLTPRKELRK